MGLVSGVGDEWERIDEGRHRARGFVLTLANTGLFMADLMGSPFLCTGTLFFLVSRDMLFCVPAAATVTVAFAKVVYDIFDTGRGGIDSVVQCG